MPFSQCLNFTNQSTAEQLRHFRAVLLMTGRKSKDISRRRKFPFCRCTILQQCDKKENRCSRLFVLNSSNLAPGQAQQITWKLTVLSEKYKTESATTLLRTLFAPPPSVPYLQKLDLLSVHILAFTLLGFSVVPAAGKVKKLVKLLQSNMPKRGNMSS